MEGREAGQPDSVHYCPWPTSSQNEDPCERADRVRYKDSNGQQPATRELCMNDPPHAQEEAYLLVHMYDGRGSLGVIDSHLWGGEGHRYNTRANKSRFDQSSMVCHLNDFLLHHVKMFR